MTRRTFVCSASTLVLQPTLAGAQTRWSGGVQGACSFYPTDVIERDLFTFGSNAEAFNVVKRITNAVGLEPNFEVVQANVPNAAAVIRDEKRYVLFSQVFIDQIVRATSTEWASWTILAHEIGHHLNGHTLEASGSRPPIELQADRFAGHAIKRLGGSLNDALACFQQMGAAGSATHPPRSARLEAVSRGWHEAVGPSVAAPRPAPESRTPPAPAPAPGHTLRRVKADVSLGYLNMRSGPGTNNPVVSQIPAGASGVRLTERCVRPGDGASRYPFCYVEWNGLKGWVSLNGLE